eukprot:TRINITY_DN52417_c0_g1_i1.p1 TRINITY_DN52417_c0_g1~~TRINITY_DN52417_c0_g1_i1.p1  ORF type:complete len:145 (+),score=43.51 TRINITY_DN52417_c0_g1_i1:52-486(+)
MGANQGKCCAGDDVAQDPMPLVETKVVTPALAEQVIDAPNVDAQPALSGSRKPGPGEQFSIVLKKTADRSKLGIDVDLTDNMALVVDSIKDGLVMDWNRDHEGLPVGKNDRIISVNGIKGDAQQLTELCRVQETLEMVVQKARQ